MFRHLRVGVLELVLAVGLEGYPRTGRTLNPKPESKQGNVASLLVNFGPARLYYVVVGDLVLVKCTVKSPRVQVPNTHRLSKIRTYITTFLKPST